MSISQLETICQRCDEEGLLTREVIFNDLSDVQHPMHVVMLSEMGSYIVRTTCQSMIAIGVKRCKLKRAANFMERELQWCCDARMITQIVISNPYITTVEVQFKFLRFVIHQDKHQLLTTRERLSHDPNVRRTGLASVKITLYRLMELGYITVLFNEHWLGTTKATQKILTGTHIVWDQRWYFAWTQTNAIINGFH